MMERSTSSVHSFDLSNNNHFLYRAISLSPLPTLLYAEDGEILMHSQGWQDLSGYRPEEVPTIQEWTKKAYGEESSEVLTHIQSLFDREHGLDEGRWELQTKSGEIRIWHFHSVPVGFLPDGRRLVISKALDETALHKNETELKQHRDHLENLVFERTKELNEKNRELQNLAILLSQSEQRERHRLASTLHDNLQQLIAAAKLQLLMLIEKEEALKPGFQKPLNLLNDAIKECKNLSAQLAPPILYNHGLIQALIWFCGWVDENYHFKVTHDLLTEKEPENLDNKVLLFQCIRELIFNTFKHAGVKKAHLRVESVSPDIFRVTISDQGKGFSIHKKRQINLSSGFGLFSIQERIQCMGGKVIVDSTPGKGTTVVIEVCDSLCELNQ